METTHKIIQDLFYYGIIKVSADPPFTLTSGKRAPVYLDHRKIWTVPSLRHTVTKAWCDVLRPAVAGISLEKLMIAGTATAGIAPAYALAEALGCSFVYVRDKPKSHGLQTAIEGLLPPAGEGRLATQVVVVDDMVTTGKSLLKASELMKESGFSLVCGTSVSRHPLRLNVDLFKEAELPLVSIFQTDQLFIQAHRLGCIQEQELAMILDWLRELDQQT